MTTQVITYNLQKVLSYRERIIGFLIAIIVIAATAYIYFVHKAVVNVVSRQTIMQEIQKTDSSMNGLESQYLALDNAINVETATRDGFIPTDVTAFIPTKSAAIVASLQN